MHDVSWIAIVRGTTLMQVQKGIILRKRDEGRLTILDEQLGKIVCSIKRDDVCIGAYVHYVSEKRHITSFVRTLEQLEAPFALAREDIVFVHHLLEICDTSLLSGMVLPSLIPFFLYVYELGKACVFTSTMKKIIALKLLVYLGLYPDDMELSCDMIHYYMNTPIDTLLQENIKLHNSYDLNYWLYECIKSNLDSNCFKTIHFLKVNEQI
ncbi:MAG: hypothetical protein WBQ73_03675 [Candidatus Babeliales bacterium]